MAAAENGRDTLYFTFGDNQLRDEIFDVYTLLTRKEMTIGAIYKASCYAEYTASFLDNNLFFCFTVPNLILERRAGR